MPECTSTSNVFFWYRKLSLKYAYFGGTRFTDKVIMKIAWFCPKLKTLSIPYLKVRFKTLFLFLSAKIYIHREVGIIARSFKVLDV
jgi:hypothetical protein